MDAKERATEFVNKYPLMFTEDKEFWITEIALMILAAEKAQLGSTLKLVDKAIDKAFL